MKAVELSMGEVLEAAESGRLGEVRGRLESGDYIVLRVYGLPRVRVRWHTSTRRIEEADEGRLERLHYSLIYTQLRGARRFRDFANTVGDWRAAAVYISQLWRMGLVEIPDQAKAIDIYMAATTFKQKGYERRIARAADAEIRLRRGELEKLPVDDVVCVLREGKLLCSYKVASRVDRVAARAQARALQDAVIKS